VLVRRISQLALFILVGLCLAWALSIDVVSLPHSTSYRLGAYLLLTIGLYGVTSGIDLEAARRDRRVIVPAVTVGVVCKAIIIGGTLAVAWRDPLFLILGVAVAQIDPLSVAALLGNKRMSSRAQAVLATWASFDDPFTVVLSIYAAAIAVNTFGIGDTASSGTGPLVLYAANLAGNLALAVLAWGLWRLIAGRAWLQYAALLAFLATATLTGWMLAVALVGLFARPHRLVSQVPRITQWAMYAASVALGVLLVDGVDIARGATLGIAAFSAHALIAWPLTRGMPRVDRWHLAAAQQNGITAIILALTLQTQFDGVVAVVAPAIIVANLIHLTANWLLDRRLARPPASPSERPAALDSAPGDPGQLSG